MIEPNSFVHGDCMNYLTEYPDNYFDLAIVDPPYGIGVGSMTYAKGVEMATNSKAKRRDYRHSEWDIRPPKEYFDELRRVSKKQVVWGGITSLICCHPAKVLYAGISAALTI